MSFYDRTIYFPYKKKLFLQDIEILLKKDCLKSKFKKNLEIKDISSLSNIRENSILFIDRFNIDFDSIKSKNVSLITTSNELFNKFDDNIFFSFITCNFIIYNRIRVINVKGNKP